MSEDIYAKLDLSKKVRFQTGENKEEKEKEEERGNADVCDNIDNVVIYDNCWTEGSTPPKPEDNTTDDQQQTASISQSPAKRNLLRAAAVSLGLLCLVLLAAVIVLGALWIRDKIHWARDKDIWTMERDRLRVDITNLTSEKDRLQNYSYSVVESYNETKNVNRNLTRKIHQLENENNLLTDIKNNLTIERDDLLEQIAETSCCPDYWIRFGKSCYFISTSSKNWFDSKKFCKDRDAHLVIISNDEEQKFVSSLKQRVWIGLTDEETEGVWKWVDGTEVTKKYWGNKQPDNAGKGEHCVEIYTVFGPFKNWNDMRCWTKSNFICEKILG